MSNKILIMAGGTGGHVFPALAVAKLLQNKGIEVHWLGTLQGMENDIVNKANIPLHAIPIQGWRGKKLAKWLTAPFKLARAVYIARKIILDLNPDVVLGMGGFVSGPGGIATRLLKKPLVIHEQNAIPGLTNKILASFASQVLEAFPGTFPNRNRVTTVGNPIREDISKLPTPQERISLTTNPLRLLVLGGSQGAQIINQIVPAAIAILSVEERPDVWHQSGKNNFSDTQHHYQVLRLKAKVEPFIDDMAAAYQWADLVIARAGASTVSELAGAGVGSILIPYLHAVDNHQFYNAQYLAQGKAAIILPQTEFSAARLAENIRRLLLNRTQLVKMAEAARSLSQDHAAEKVAEKCIDCMQKNQEVIHDVIVK